MPTDIAKLPLGGPAWLRAIAKDKEEMLDALGSFDADSEREEKREILGLLDAATRLERTEVKLNTALTVLGSLNRRVHSGYDFNADPDQMTKLVGDLLAMKED